jgi:hypothetical protein
MERLEIVPRRAFKVERERAYLGLLEANCFVGVAVAGNYGVLCLVAANGDPAVFHSCETHSGERSYWSLSSGFIGL